MNRLWLSALLALTAAPTGWAAAPGRPAASESSDSGGGGFFNFLLPKSLQKNPKLSFNIVTEMTPEGRKLAPPTAEKPVYFFGQSGGVHHLGINPENNLKAPTTENLQRMMENALAEAHYLPTNGTTAQMPTIVVFYQFGSHSFQPPASVAPDTPPGETPPDPSTTGDVPVPEITLRKALLDRAQLLGGKKFLKDVSEAMEQTDRKAGMEAAHVAPEGGGDFMGSVASMIRDPFDELRNKSPEYERLVDELFSSSFFAVASAYDYAALAKNQRKLLWRTKMTVNSLGVNMVESLPPLVAAAAPYLGHETLEPVVITKRVNRNGNVEVGEAKVVEADVKLPDQKSAPASTPAPTQKK